jgi:hypothetical protein
MLSAIGLTSDNAARAKSFFDRALIADADSFDALIESGYADLVASLLGTDSMAAFGAAEAKLTKALSSVPDQRVAICG